MPTAHELYHTLCETTAELQPVLTALLPLVSNPHVQQTYNAIEHVLRYQPSRGEDAIRTQLVEYISEVGNALVPACYHLGHLSYTEARIARSAIQKVLDYTAECANELVCI